MPGVLRETIEFVGMGQRMQELRKDGYDRFYFKLFDLNRKFVEMKAWKYRPRPDRRRNPE